MARIFLSLGSNFTSREEKINSAIKRLNQNNIKTTRISPIYETIPSGDIKLLGINCPFNTKQGNFLNLVVEAFTDYMPEVLLSKIIAIEKSLGRIRIPGLSNLPRTIDIDILFYDSKIINQSMLKIPHPRLHTRSFVLIPLADLEPSFVHPVINKTIKELTEHISKKGVVLWQRQELKISA